MTPPSHQVHDVIIIGSGLAGLTVALQVLDRGARSVVVIEKESSLGGNSNKASSGMNAAADDNVSCFYNDTLESAGQSAQPDKIRLLVNNSHQALGWLQERVSVDLPVVSQLGGHSVPRTHRPAKGSVGFELIKALQTVIRTNYDTQVTILTNTKATRLLTEGDVIVGVETINVNSAQVEQHSAKSVVLATGGFAAHQNAVLSQYRPDLLNMPATSGSFATGDGIRLAPETAALVDMEEVQLHPTGFVDPKDPQNESKILAAEALRGAGGILLNAQGKRFCNELGRRDYVVEQMQLQDSSSSSLVLCSSAANEVATHLGFYVFKGLLTKLNGIQALADWMQVPVETLGDTMNEYTNFAGIGRDAFGKKVFNGLPKSAELLDNEVFYAGHVTPVLHYCMGGLAIDTSGRVLKKDNTGFIPGIYAVGEVSGGVHGENRLGGNSLLECVVFGTAVASNLPLDMT